MSLFKGCFRVVTNILKYDLSYSRQNVKQLNNVKIHFPQNIKKCIVLQYIFVVLHINKGSFKLTLNITLLSDQ